MKDIIVIVRLESNKVKDINNIHKTNDIIIEFRRENFC